MAAFAQGFLAPKGIQIDSVGAINRMVDQQIRAQEEAIQRGEWLVGEDRDLWSLARAGAADQAEARGRLRALKLAGMQADIQAHVSQVGTKLALADGAVVQAKIQAALDDTKTALTSTFYNRAVDIHKNLLSARLEEAKISVEKDRIASAERIAGMQAAARQKQLMPFVSPIKGDVKNGQAPVLGFFRPGVSSDQISKVNDAVAKAADIQTALDRYEKLAQRVGGDNRVIGGRITRLDDHDEAMLKEGREAVVRAVAKALNPGERFGQQFMDQIRDRIPLPTETGASMLVSIQAAHLASVDALDQAQTVTAQYVTGYDGVTPLSLGYSGPGGSALLESTLTALPDPSKPGSLDYYIMAAASPTDPNGKPDPMAISAVGSIYQVAIDPKNPDQARALEQLKYLADSNVDNVSPFLQASAESFLLSPQLVKNLTPEDRAHYTRSFATDEKRAERRAAQGGADKATVEARDLTGAGGPK
jgi:hypothetical protein